MYVPSSLSQIAVSVQIAISMNLLAPFRLWNEKLYLGSVYVPAGKEIVKTPI